MKAWFLKGTAGVTAGFLAFMFGFANHLSEPCDSESGDGALCRLRNFLPEQPHTEDTSTGGTKPTALHVIAMPSTVSASTTSSIEALQGIRSA